LREIFESTLSGKGATNDLPICNGKVGGDDGLLSVVMNNNTHSKLFGYLLWIFGFTGSHRFYYGRPISGTIWFFTLGLLGIGWLIDLFLIPSMDRAADAKYVEGPKDYNVTWLLLTFLGVFGIHKFYLEKWLLGILYLCTFGFLGLGYLYDLWTLNGQVDEINRRALPPRI
jgi:TM2 domain-containing membrane protein YozV